MKNQKSFIYLISVKSLIFKIVLIVFITTGLNASSQSWQKEVHDKTKGQENNFYAVQQAFNNYWADKTPAKGDGYK